MNKKYLVLFLVLLIISFAAQLTGGVIDINSINAIAGINGEPS